MYDARDLTTHGVVVGMTGSGKTGLGIALLEEAAIDGIPCIIIDPKGDLTNLLLQFPDLDPAKFEKWLNPEDAQQKGISPRQLAEQLSSRWRQGLEETAQAPSASAGCGPPPITASTRRAARPACRCPSSAPSPPRKPRCRAKP